MVNDSRKFNAFEKRTSVPALNISDGPSGDALTTGRSVVADRSFWPIPDHGADALLSPVERRRLMEPARDDRYWRAANIALHSLRRQESGR